MLMMVKYVDDVAMYCLKVGDNPMKQRTNNTLLSSTIMNSPLTPQAILEGFHHPMIIL